MGNHRAATGVANAAADDQDLNELLTRWDTYHPEHEKVRHDVLAHARSHCPVPRTEPDNPATGGFYLVTRFEDVRRVLQDWETFSSTEGLPTPMPIRLCPIDTDPPLHTEIRNLLNPLFSRQHLLQYEPMIRRTAADLVAQWAPRGEVELISQFAAPLVGTVLMHIVMGPMDPETRSRATEVVIGCAHHPTPEHFAALVQLSAERLAIAEQNPELATGVLKALTTTRADGHPLTTEERLGVLNILFLGGLDTTRSAISMIALRVAQNPKLEQRIRDPRWIKHDLDEFLRIDSPVATFGRVATRDVELSGVPIRKGERLLIRYDSANRDEERFPNADELVFDPSLRPSNAAFGLGVHRCLGAHLARLTIPVAWEEILKRATNFRMGDDPNSLVWEAGIANGPTTVPLVFDAVEDEQR